MQRLQRRFPRRAQSADRRLDQIIIQQPGRVRNSPLRTRPGMFKMKKVKNLYFPPRTAGWPDTIFSVLPGRFFHRARHGCRGISLWRENREGYKLESKTGRCLHCLQSCKKMCARRGEPHGNRNEKCSLGGGAAADPH